jgi:5-methylcytosine-specific restriction endonuclease McrA
VKKYTKVYMDYFGYCIEDFIPCETCGTKAVDIHHIDARGMGGSSIDKDNITNIMALCRNCHIKYGDKKDQLEYLKKKHKEKIDSNG